jgi:hypothetical protein
MPPKAALAIIAARASGALSRWAVRIAVAMSSSRDPWATVSIRGRARHLVTEEPRVDLALGGAPGEVQQAGVVHGDLVVLGQPHGLGQPQGEHRGTQPMLKRLAQRQVCGQRQHPGGFS